MRNGYDGPSLTLDEARETLQCFMSAFALQPPWRAQPTHYCDGLCPLFRHRSVYVCCWSGNFHYCTDTACNRIVTFNATNKVCSLTSMSYELDFQATFEQGACNEEYKRNTRIVPTTRKRKEDNLASKTTSKKRQPAVQKVPDNIDVHVLVRKLLPTLSGERHADISHEVASCFTRIRSTTSFMQRKSNSPYTLDMHTIIVVYCMAHGGERHMGVEWIRPHSDVRTSLVRIDSQPFSVVGASTRKQYRNALKLFKPFMYEYVASL